MSSTAASASAFGWIRDLLVVLLESDLLRLDDDLLAFLGRFSFLERVEKTG